MLLAATVTLTEGTEFPFFIRVQSGVPGSGPDSGAAIMRGPMAGRVVTQL